MTHRLPSGGRLIDRGQTLRFTFDGRAFTGHAGDTLASALMANGVRLMGRSFKYHRPRGPVSAGVEEPNALVGLGRGDRFTPNLRATVTPLADGLESESQNRWPSLAFDIGRVADRLAPLLPAGFYYKTFLAPRPAWKHLYEPLIRRAAGLGRAPAPETRDPDTYEQVYAFCDVLVAGGGLAGLTAALGAAQRGQRVIVMEEVHWGGRTLSDGTALNGASPDAWLAATLAALGALPNVTLLPRTSVAGVFDHGYCLGLQTPAQGPRERLWRVRAGHIVNAAGAIERPLAFAGNDLPGVMLASAMRDYLANWAVAPGRRVVLATACDDAYRTALALHAAGIEVAAIVDARPAASGALPDAARARGLRVLEGTAIRHATGRRGVEAVALCRHDGTGAAITETLACDAVAMSGGWSPAVHLWSHAGGRLVWDEAGVCFRPDPARPPLGADGAPLVTCLGAANGTLPADAVAAEAAVWAGLPPPTADAPPEAPPAAVWLMPANAAPELRAKAFLDFQNDVKVSDVELAAREGFVSVEHAKRYTTLGMATDQGKLSNINGLAILAAAQGATIPETGTTTFRPPWTPLTLAAIAAEAKGPLFQPVRHTPLHPWHAAHGAVWEPVGLWRRPYAYPLPGESTEKAVAREVRNTRQTVGLLDASTLGKLLVRGPDAGRFLDMLYTGTMSTLAPGRCRYGVMCNENGFVIDDGVVARLDEQTWLCHNTTGGAERIHAHMEDWLQCEWWDWRVHVVNLTEQFAQIAVAGPNARRLLEKLGGMDLSAERLPHMAWAEGTLASIPARVFRISFSGELGFEVAVPAGQGLGLWERLIAAGTAFGAMPYGTEALHVLRAEKGFIMIGDETDGTVTPGDLGLPTGARKPDFIGKRGLARPHLSAPDRWRLVGLETLDGSVLPHGALAVTGRLDAFGARETEGRVTSSYFSPTLGRGIALGLVRHGPERMGAVLTFPAGWGRAVKARIIAPAFHDPDGARLHV